MKRMRTIIRVLCLVGILAGLFVAIEWAGRLAQAAAPLPPAPAGMVAVPGGWFWMGSDDPDADEDARPRRRVWVERFFIRRHEVTNAEFARFKLSHHFPKGAERLPVTGVTWDDADAYARWAGGQLPTEVEWEKAARGTDGRRYPWGSDFDPARANVRRLGKGAPAKGAGCAVPGARRGLRRVGSFPEGVSPYGALDMAGNAWEWTDGFYNGHPDRRVIRGGAYGYGERSARVYARGIEGSGVT